MIPMGVICRRCAKVLGISSSYEQTLAMVAEHDRTCLAHPDNRALWCGQCRSLIGVWRTHLERDELRERHLCAPEATQKAGTA